MKAMKPFYFAHPQYGKLRVVVIGGKIYYCLMDVKNIFKKSVQKLYETIADSEGGTEKSEHRDDEECENQV